MSEHEVTGVDGDTTTVITEDMSTDFTDVALVGVGDETIERAAVLKRTVTSGCVLAGMFPCSVASVGAGTNANAIDGLGDGVFTKVTGDWVEGANCWLKSVGDLFEWLQDSQFLNHPMMNCKIRF